MVIRNIWAVGRNYKAHAVEMNADIPTEPLIFLKAGSSASVNSNEIVLPHWESDIHHEVELAIKFGTHYQPSEAAIALDLTARTLQAKAKKNGEPWTLAKSFTGACAVSSFFPYKELGDLSTATINLAVNGKLRQDGKLSDLIFNIPALVEYVLAHFPVCPGDLLLTGTPAGVARLEEGDLVRTQIPGVLTHEWRVHREAASPPPSQEKS